MKVYNLSVPRRYERDGKEETAWDNVGVMFVRDDGKMSIRLSMFPNIDIVAFERDRKAPERKEKRVKDF